jgi:hypothetical protein
MVVGHSIGGFLPGLAPGFDRCSALLSVAGQYAYREPHGFFVSQVYDSSAVFWT